MEINLEIDKTKNVRIHTVEGEVTKEDLFSYLKEYYASPAFDPDMNILWDLRLAELSLFALPEVVKVRDFVEARNWLVA